MNRKTFRSANRKAGTAFALSLAIALGGCGGLAENRTLESVRQPVVERTNYTLDISSGPGGLSFPEQGRVSGWFEAMNLRAGDRVAIDDPLDSAATRAAISAIAGRYGILVSADAPVTPGYVNAGSARIIVTRSTASVPGCPDWSAKSDFNPNNATSPNYGCAVNSNLAAMVANPEHLIKGEAGQSDTVIMSSTKAIETFRKQPPTGEKGLKSQATSGN
jgi:pilus assembly protein CpaD